MTEPVMVRKTGRRPPTGAPSLKLAHLLDAGVFPTHPATYDDGAEGKTDWLMLGNDQYGDCVAVTWATQRRIASWIASVDNYPTYDQVIEVYKTQNPNFPNDDNGMVIQDLLNYLHGNGGPDGAKIVAFAQVDHTNFEELKAALYLGHQLWLGVNVSQSNESQFNSGLEWTSMGSVVGGHSITGIGYLSDRMFMETWAGIGSLSQGYVQDTNTSVPGMEEAWLVVWPETAALLTQAQRDAFQVAYGEVTGGKTIAWPTNIPPAPDPTPVPVPPVPVPVPPPPAPVPPAPVPVPPAPVPVPPAPVPPIPPQPTPIQEILAEARALWLKIEHWLEKNE